MNHKNLDAWKQAMELVEKIYIVTRGFPQEELYGLTSQIRRSAVSIVCNISEGAGRNSKKEMLNFLNYCLGSVAELETQAMIAERLGYCHMQEVLGQVTRVRSLILGLRRHLKSKDFDA